MVLARSMTRKRARLAAASLLRRHGSLSAVVSRSPGELHLGSPNIQPEAAAHLAGINKLLSSAAAARIERRPLLGHYADLITFLQWKIGGASREELHVLYLDGCHQLLGIEELGRGTLDEVYVSTRSIVGNALLANAAGLIIAHNHPTGKPAPSRYDIDLTSDVCAACKTIGITMCDHLIISGTEWYSFRLNHFDLCRPGGIQPQTQRVESSMAIDDITRAKRLAASTRKARISLKESSLCPLPDRRFI
jgi:DNA repair protein RadC